MSLQTGSHDHGVATPIRRSTLARAGTAPWFFFAGPTKTLVAEDEGTVLNGTLSDRSNLLQAAEGMLSSQCQAGPQLLVGAIPFADNAQVRLFAPNRVSTQGRWWVEPQAQRPIPLFESRPRVNETGRTKAVSQSEERRFVESVRQAVEQIQSNKLRKVVLARVKDLYLEGELHYGQLLSALRAKNPHGFTFALSMSPGVRGERTLVGASPELLLSKRGRNIVSSPLAGSVPRAANLAEDERRACALLKSPKDRHEHRFVVEQIVDNLSTIASDLRFESEPTVTATSSMWHLSTRIEATLRDRDTSSLRVALALHPTPAVCGTPTREAAAFIRDAEAFDRGMFTGTLGYMDARGDGDWIVTIRCAELGAGSVRVFAGAGIVGSSVPEHELAETEAKMGTMLEALLGSAAARGDYA